MFFSASNKAFINGPIWPDCVEVDIDVHNAIMAKLNKGYSLGADADGQPIAIEPPPAPEPTVEDLFKTQLRTLNSGYDVAVAILRGSYPFSETTTWPVQVAEAQVYDAWRKAGRNGEAPETPFLSDLTTQRDSRGVGAGLEDLIDRVLNNNSLYSPAVSYLTAVRHAAEQALRIAKASGDNAQIRAVVWDYSMPPVNASRTAQTTQV